MFFSASWKALSSSLRQRILLTAAYFFMVVAAYYVIKPVRSSLVLTHLGAAQLPVLYILTALILGFVVAGYARLLRRARPERLMLGILVSMVAQLLLFRWAFTLPYGWISGAFYLWVSLFSVITVTQFWTIADDLFTPEEAKRWFGLIGAGGIAGGILGGIAAGALVRWISSEDLILVAALLLGLCLPLLHWVSRAHRSGGEAPADASPGGRNGCASLPSYLRKFPYLRDLLVLVVAAKAVSTIIDYAFNGFVELSIPGQEARTAFFSAFYVILNSASLLVQLALTTSLFARWGVHRALAILPVGLGIGVAGLLAVPGLAFAALVAVYDRSMSYSVGQTGKEVLYVPVPRAVRYRVKPLIDAAGFRLAQGSTGLALLLLQRLGNWSYQAMGLFAIPFLVAWLLAIRRLHRVRHLLRPAARSPRVSGRSGSGAPRVLQPHA
jgi:AAA family ATP:ADP antiporter